MQELLCAISEPNNNKNHFIFPSTKMKRNTRMKSFFFLPLDYPHYDLNDYLHDTVNMLQQHHLLYEMILQLYKLNKYMWQQYAINNSNKENHEIGEEKWMLRSM